MGLELGVPKFKSIVERGVVEGVGEKSEGARVGKRKVSQGSKNKG